MKIPNDKLAGLGFKKISLPLADEAGVAPQTGGGDEVAVLRRQVATLVAACKEERAKRMRLAELLRPFLAQIQAAKAPGRAYRSDVGAPAAGAASTALAAPVKSEARVPDEVLPPQSQEPDAEAMLEEGDDFQDDLEGLLDS